MISPFVPAQRDAHAVYLGRGEYVVLDATVAQGFATTTKRVSQSVSCKLEKFDEARAFQLTDEAFAVLANQSLSESAI